MSLKIGKIAKVSIISLLMSSSVACVSQADGNLMRKDIATMTTKYEILNRKLKNNQNRIDRSLKRIDTKLADLDVTLKKAKKLLSRNNADFDQDLTSLESNIQKANGKNAEMIAKFDKLQKEFQELKDSFSNLKGDIVIASNNSTDKNENVVNVEKEAKKTIKKESQNRNTKPVVSKDANSAYSNAYKYVTGASGKSMSKKDRLGKAVTMFDALIKKYPSSPKANSARYWITQCYYAKGDYSNAYRSMNKYVNKFPKSSHIPQILFQMGTSLQKLNMKTDSKKIFKTLIRIYPKSSYAKKAQNMI